MSITSVRGYDELYAWMLSSAQPRVKDSGEAIKEAPASTAEADNVIISDLAKALAANPPPPPPEKMDFSNMSEEDLREYVSQMQALTGSVPGMAGETDIASLSSEEIEQLRATLMEMSKTALQVKERQGPPPLPYADVSSLSDEELEALLAKIQEEYGYIPGVEDSQETEVSSLTEEERQDARDALAAMMAEQARTIMLNRALSQANDAYTSVIFLTPSLG